MVSVGNAPRPGLTHYLLSPSMQCESPFTDVQSTTGRGEWRGGVCAESAELGGWWYTEKRKDKKLTTLGLNLSERKMTSLKHYRKSKSDFLT